MSNIPYLEQLTDSEVVTASKAANLAFQVQRVSNKLPYTSYVAQLSVDGSGVITANVMYNDIPATLTWSSGGGFGLYNLTASASVFTSGKTFIVFTKSFFNTNYSGTTVSDVIVYRDSNTTVRLDGSVMDSTTRINGSLVEIRVYN